jgi:SNF2 family DNA or RNA helicase
LQGNLRDYQRRGVAWLQYLEQLGLNPCLADDMGLGKTMEVIAHLLKEREKLPEGECMLPTLVIAPTSVLGNWRREIERFAPQLRVVVHQGSSRLKEKQAFVEMCRSYDVVLTSFALARLDEKLLQSVQWQRVVVDEAQNIKNPQAAQTRAILKLAAPHRLALTGTPVENRLRDLWSIFNFLNPGYLGKEAQFRKSFETPIYKNNDLSRSETLKKLVEPFILRRVKTDKRIIDDLPDKIEQKMYCTLSPEQASLYEAVVNDVSQQIEQAEGMQRRGLILSTLLKLKQICNHPAQFLQDGSAFTTERSHKLQRLGEMIEEVIESGESALVFTQFTEIGSALERYLEHNKHYNTYYLHGGTSVTRRDQMVTEFQDAETEPSLFILSLRAGGVGLNLTKANHVFHFDRWWNPAVEDQATDRAFRIGQRKNVFVHKFVALGTMEERIDAMIEDKKRLSSLVVGTDEAWLTELDNDTFKDLIALRRSAVVG